MALFAAFALLHADQAADLRSELDVIARGLSAGDAAAAMTPFDKSLNDYDKLTNYFGGLTNAFNIVNEIDVSDEQDSNDEIKATVHWTITLSDLGSNYTERRVGDINLRVVQRDRKWKIVEFAPIDIFDPRPKPWAKEPQHQ
jgi:hypothetical protein